MKKIFKALGAVLASALLLAGCSDVDSGSDSSSSSVDSSKAYIKIVDKESSSRTALPTAFQLSDFDYFNIYAIKDGTGSYPSSWDAAYGDAAGSSGSLEDFLLNEKPLSGDELGNLLELSKGIYWFMLEAGNNKNFDDLRFVGTLHTEIEAGENALSFDLFPAEYSTSGKGTVDFTVSFPGVVKKVTLSIADFTYDSNNNTGTWTRSSAEWTSSSTRSPITNNSINYVDEKTTSGIYLFSFDFYSKEDATLYTDSLKTYRELVVVADGKTSTYSFTIDSLSVPIWQRIKDEADTIGDIVFANGKAVAYDPSITRADIAAYCADTDITDGTTTTTTTVGVVYYAGPADSKSATANEEALGDRVLCVALGGTTTTSSPVSSTTEYSMRMLSWAKNTTVDGYSRNLQTLAVCDYSDTSSINEKSFESYTATNGKIFAGWYTDTDKKDWVDPLFVGTTASTLLANGAADNPAGYGYTDLNDFPAFASISDAAVGDTAGQSGKLQNSVYYLPSVIELLELCKVKDTVNKSLALLVENPWDILGGTESTYHKDRYWSSSQSARENTLAWSVGFYGENNVGVPVASDKTEKNSVVAIFEYDAK